MADAPRDEPILAWCVDECGQDHCSVNSFGSHTLCLYHGHAEGLSSVEEGPNVVVWGGSWDDSTHEYAGGWMPDWWFLRGSEFEIAANPIAWKRIGGLGN